MPLDYDYRDSHKKDISLVEKAYIVLLAICPILQHYKGLFFNAAITALIITGPYVFFRLCREKKLTFNRLKYISPLIVFFLFKVIDHGTSISEAGQAALFTVVVIGIACNCLDTKFFIRVVLIISSLASICIILQYICHYVFGFHLQMVPTSLLLDSSSQWILAAQTGQASITGRASRFYRPSAFFLEPSHMFIYMFMPLLFVLFSSTFRRKERIYSILITIGMVLCTSGLGIATAIGSWLLFLGKTGGENNKFTFKKFLRKKSMLLFFSFLVVALVLFMGVPFFQNSIVRIFSSGSDYTNAITGRVEAGTQLVTSLRGKYLLIGVSDTLTGISYNMSGFNSTMYRYGIIGTLISYGFYIHGIRLKDRYFWISMVIILLSFFSAHTHSTFFMIYSTFIIMQGYNEREEKLRSNLQGLNLKKPDKMV